MTGKKKGRHNGNELSLWRPKKANRGGGKYGRETKRETTNHRKGVRKRHSWSSRGEKGSTGGKKRWGINRRKRGG